MVLWSSGGSPLLLEAFLWEEEARPQKTGRIPKGSPEFCGTFGTILQESGPKKPWQPQTWQDLTRFSPLDFSLLSPDFGGLVLLNRTENLEKKQKIQWRASSADGAPKLQIPVPCRGRTCPEGRIWGTLRIVKSQLTKLNYLDFRPCRTKWETQPWGRVGIKARYHGLRKWYVIVLALVCTMG